jgi:precorrin-6A/cobalt-precorrin-6A reductase
MACAAGRVVLLTTGSRNLADYVSEAASRGCRLLVRVLPAPESIAACRQAGIPDADVIAARGPFSEEENQAVLRRFGVDVMVAKDSGEAGGLPAKIAAARCENCAIVLIRRFPEANPNQVQTLTELLRRVGPSA